MYWFAKAVHSGERLEQLVGDPNMSYSESAAAGISHGLSSIPWAESESKQSNLDKDKLGLFIEVLERFKEEVEEDQVCWGCPWRLSTNAHGRIRSLEQPCFGVIFGKRYNDGSSGPDDCRFLDLPILPSESLVR